MKLELNHRRKIGQYKLVESKSHTFKQLMGQRKITREIGKSLETNEMKTQYTEVHGMP